MPDHLVVEIAGRLSAQKKLLGQLFGLMFPTLFGCRSIYELTCVRGWDKPMPSRLLSALPKRSWLQRLRKLGQDFELVGQWDSGHYKRVVSGLDGVLVMVVIGAGKRVVPGALTTLEIGWPLLHECQR